MKRNGQKEKMKQDHRSICSQEMQSWDRFKYALRLFDQMLKEFKHLNSHMDSEGEM
jgi:hypothetical protein